MTTRIDRETGSAYGLQIMDKIQLIFFFISGFLVSRLIIKVKLPQRLVYWFIGKKHLSITKILFYLIAISAFLSFFIPNAITVLTLLPLLELLRRSYEESNGSSRRIATMLALAIIYGANIGGMGSLTATPANGILVTFAVLENVPGTRDISFASWLVWGIPLVAIFVCVAWLVLITILRPWKLKANSIQLPFQSTDVYHPFQKTTVWITIFYFISSFILSLLLMRFSNQTNFILVITGIITLLFVLFLFFLPIKGSDKHTSKQVLLTIPDCYNELPMKGFMFVAIAIVLAGILYALSVHEYFPRWVRLVIPVYTSTLFFVFCRRSSDLLFNGNTQQYGCSNQFFYDGPAVGGEPGCIRPGNFNHHYALLYLCLYEPDCHRRKRPGIRRC